MKILIDMNLTPDWAGVLSRHGHQAVHWSTVGNPRASDGEIMRWAADRGFVLFTNDLGFGALMAAAQGRAPSVIQVRTQDLMPARLERTVVSILSQYETRLAEGIFLVVDEARLRVRILPLPPLKHPG